MAPSPHPYLQWPGPIAFAHRGGAREAPENTMAAFEHAVRLGYTYLETDVHVSADGVVVAFHDTTLLRTCGRPERVGELPWSELSHSLVDGLAPIPMIEEVIGTWPEVRVNIDCKTDAAVPGLIAAVRRTNSFDRVCLASFSDRRVAALRTRAGRPVCTSFGWGGLARLRFGPGTYRPERLAGAVVAQVPERYGAVTVVTPQFMAAARGLGVKVHVWTVDDASVMERLLDMGVDGIMTDRPRVLRDVLRRREQWQQPADAGS